MNITRIEEMRSFELARLLDLNEELTWSECDCADALRHQLEAPLLPDLLVGDSVDAQELKALLEHVEGPVRFGAQIMSATPALTVLVAIKFFAKQVKSDLTNPLAPHGAEVLYFASIAAALVGCGTRISTLSDLQLREGFRWARRQPGAESLEALFCTSLATLRL